MITSVKHMEEQGTEMEKDFLKDTQQTQDFGKESRRSGPGSHHNYFSWLGLDILLKVKNTKERYIL